MFFRDFVKRRDLSDATKIAMIDAFDDTGQHTFTEGHENEIGYLIERCELREVPYSLRYDPDEKVYIISRMSAKKVLYA